MAQRVVEGRMVMTTRYRPKREAELEGGSLFWIIKHQLVARAPIEAFADSADGRIDIVLRMPPIPVRPQPKRAHQGWRYLTQDDAPLDLVSGEGADILPTDLARNLAALGLD